MVVRDNSRGTEEKHQHAGRKEKSQSHHHKHKLANILAFRRVIVETLNSFSLTRVSKLGDIQTSFSFCFFQFGSLSETKCTFSDVYAIKHLIN